MKKTFFMLIMIACFALSVFSQTQSERTSSPEKKATVTRRAVKTDQTRPSTAPLSPAIVAGDFVFVSGQLGVDPKSGEFVGSTTEEQAEQVLKNLAAVLGAAGSDLDNVVKTTVFLADMDEFSKVNEIYRRHFKADPPARSTVQVARLPRNARIEIEAIAIVRR